jgi:AraC family transcriptional regulator
MLGFGHGVSMERGVANVQAACRLGQLFAPDTQAAAVEAYHCQTRSWLGCEVRNVQVSGEQGLSIESPNRGRLRLAFLLENGQARAEFRSRRERRASTGHLARAVSIVPAGVTVWACSEQPGSVRFASLAVDPEEIVARLGDAIPRDTLLEPQLNVVDERLWQLGSTLARESAQPDAYSSLACDSLVTLLLVQLFRSKEQRSTPARVARLSPAQLRRVTEHIESQLAERISLAELAQLAGTSQSHFCHAFKATTGLAPHRWQLEARIRHSQALLSCRHSSVADVALATGFADQSHFTRVFRRVVGETPASWRRVRSAS